MNAKRAKAIRRNERTIEANNLAYQDMLRQQIPVPVTTMSMADFNKAHDEFRESVLGAEMEQADAINQEIKIGLLQQNAKHYIGSEMVNVESRRAAKALLPTPSTEELDRLQQSVNGPEAYAKMSSMGSADKVLHNGRVYKLTDMHGDMGVICHIKPEPFIPEFKLSSMCGDGGVACRVMPASKDAQ